MIPKGGIRLSEKIMLKRKDRAHPDSIGMEQALGQFQEKCETVFRPQMREREERFGVP
jgi:hypothetical protein